MRSRPIAFLVPLLAPLALVATPSPALAQIGMNPVQDYINKTSLLNNILSNRRATDMSQQRQGAAGTGRAQSGDAAATEAANPSAFRHSGAPILPAVLSERAAAGSARDASVRFFGSLLDLYTRTARTDGFPEHDLAYALEYYVVNTYMTYHDLHEVPYDKDPRIKRSADPLERLQLLAEKKALKVSMSQERAVFNQIRGMLAANPSIARLSDREKQEATELLAIMMGVNYSTYMRGVETGDDRLLQEARQGARQNLERLLGLPVDRIKIGSKGLEQ
ncbi:MAG: hypothetical protein IPK33_03960 [Gemmatimonadetes bacterium]|jgi:hypothetical protein|nr:hypothetical protein [Gemmatimonadota bacterium]